MKAVLSLIKSFRLNNIRRDAILFVGGLLGIANETFIHTGAERPYLLVIFSGMAGLPVFMNQDERKSGADNDDESTPKTPKKKARVSINDLASLLEQLEKK